MDIRAQCRCYRTYPYRQHNFSSPYSWKDNYYTCADICEVVDVRLVSKTLCKMHENMWKYMTAPGRPTIEIELFAAMNHLYLRSSDAKAIPRSFHRRGCQDFEFRSTSEAVDTHNEDGIDILDIKPAEELGTQESKICCYSHQVCTLHDHMCAWKPKKPLKLQ